MHQAKTELSKLLESAEAGEDVVIARAGTPVARLVPVRAGERRPGRLKGRIRTSEDFDAPLPSDVRRAFGQTDP